MNRGPAFLSCLVLAVAVGVSLSAAAEAAAGYPRLGLYGGIQGIGYPFILGGNVNGPLDLATCDSVARYDQVVLDASPITEYRNDILTALRARRPGISLLAYINAGEIWPAANADSTVHYPTRLRRLVRDLNGFLYDRQGGHYTHYNINLAKRDGFGRYVVAEAMAQLFYDVIVRPRIWDGMFFDVFCNRIAWSQSPAESIDYQRAGYSTLAAFDAAYQAGGEVLANRVREMAGPAFLLVGNCAQGTKYAAFNGWMRENFPYQNGGNWYENMFRDPGGYFIDEDRFRAPRHNYIFTGAEPHWAPYTPNNARKVRFGLGSASLGEGYGAFGNSSREINLSNYTGWWYDEYAVDLATGRSSDRQAHTGWLGQPLGPASQMIWVGTNPDASTNPGFETSVTAGWTFAAGTTGATVTRDATTAGSGAASARIHVQVVGDYDWRVNFGTQGTIPVANPAAYAATFWGRASTTRTIPVVLQLAGGTGEIARRTVELTPTWTRYQVVLIANGQGNGRLNFYLGGATGDVWLDDVHLQAGVTHLWRRDFQNGVVLVNPSNESLTVGLGRTLRRIAGTIDPAINDGLSSTSITIAGQDARFLLGDDIVHPGPVFDLRPVSR